MIINKYLFKNLLDFLYIFSLGLSLFFIIICFSVIFVAYSISPFAEKDFFLPNEFSFIDENKGCTDNKCKSWPLAPQDNWYKLFTQIILIGTIIRNYNLDWIIKHKGILSIPIVNFMILAIIFFFTIPLSQLICSVIMSVKSIFLYVFNLKIKDNNDIKQTEKIIPVFRQLFEWIIDNILINLVKLFIFIALLIISLFLIFVNTGMSPLINLFYFIGCLFQIRYDINSLKDTFFTYPGIPFENINFKNITICFAIIIAIISAYDSFYQNNNEDVFSGIALSGAAVLLLTIFNMIS